jgi:hypothetical protein
MATFPIVLSIAGYVPQLPSALQQQLIANVAATNPDYTANLPGSMIEDVSSTDVFALLQCDSSIAEIINSITPYGANAFLLNQLGAQAGVSPQSPNNTSVYVQFAGSPGYVIAQGFVVSDGTYQYILQENGVILSNGVSASLLALATQSGSWAIPAGTVNQLNTSVPTGFSLSVTNPEPGIPATTGETEEQYRSRVLQASLALCQGSATYLKTLLRNIQGVQFQLVSVRQVGTSPVQWEIICGGGDQYAVANAIYLSLFDFNNVVGSVLSISGITNANPGVVTTVLNHGFATGQVINIAGVVGMTGVNNTPLTITVITEKTFSIGINTTSSGSYVSGGVVTPNLRNVTTSLIDYPDTYSITFVNPPQQTVSVVLTWNTISTAIIAPATVAQLATPAISDYINSIAVGQPINLFELNTAFQVAVANILPAQLLTRIVWAISINGIGTSPSSGTGEVIGDPESYFYTDSTLITVSQG